MKAQGGRSRVRGVNKVIIPCGTDTFFIKNGKIAARTFAFKMVEKH